MAVPVGSRDKSLMARDEEKNESSGIDAQRDVKGIPIIVSEGLASDYIAITPPQLEARGAPAGRAYSVMSSGSHISPEVSSPAKSREAIAYTESLQPIDSEAGRQQLIFDIGNLVKHQDRVISQRVQAQMKREGLKHLRDQVATQYDKIAQLLRVARDTGSPPDDVLLANYQDDLESARNELGPAEEEFSNLEIQLVNEEAKLRRLGDQITAQWQTFPNSQRALPTNPPPVVGDDTLTEFAFASSTAEPEQTPELRARSFGVNAENDLDHGPSISIRLGLPQDAPEDQPNSRLATQATSGRRAEDIISSRLDLETSIDLDTPDLKTGMQSVTDAEEPELYVHVNFKEDLPELEGLETNTMEYLEPILTRFMPKLVTSILTQFGKLANTNQALRRWATHHVRKSARDMVEYQYGFDTDRLEALIRLSEPDQDGWIDVSWPDCSFSILKDIYASPNSRPKRSSIIWW